MKRAVLAAVAVVASLGATAWEKKSAPIMTKWSEQVTPENVLPEYPRPQMVRAKWMNLNGIWEFDGTTGITNRIPYTEWKGADPAVFKAVTPGKKLPREILVPYPVESALSGVMERMEYMKYRRLVKIPADWKGKRVRLNLDAVDWQCEVYVNGRSVGEHRGGYDPFSFDITDALKPGDNEIIVSAYDPTDNGTQPVGKQRNEPEGYWYTANSGIWQTVWLEPVDEAGATRLKLIPHYKEGWLGVTVYAPDMQQQVELVAVDPATGKKAGAAKGAVNAEIRLEIPNPKPWTPDTPFLYDLKIAVKRGGRTVDEIASYFGMRDVGMKEIDGVMRPTINGEFVFQLGTLDQGYWPDGNLRAPTDEALKSDIQAHKDLGFNLIRKHIKVEPSRWFYWCDKIGMLVWQDMPSMHTHAIHSRDDKKRKGFRPDAEEKKLFEGELKAMIDAHVNSPAVVCWILFNEGWAIYERKDVGELSDRVSAYDPSRLVNDSTGLPNEHASGDVYDIHIYTGPSSSPYPALVGGGKARDSIQALGEFGGMGMNVKGHSWFDRGGISYDDDGNICAGSERGYNDLVNRYDDMMAELFNLMYYPGLSASMYTQISDVEGETNGILTYDRKVLKFDAKRMRKAHDRIVEESKRLKHLVSANDGLALPGGAKVTVAGGDKAKCVFAATASDKAPVVAALVAEATVAVPAEPAAEAGVVARSSGDGAYYLGVRGDGTLFIRGEGPIFEGRKAPLVEKKTALKGSVPLKVTVFGSTLAVQSGADFVTVRDPMLAVGTVGVFAKAGTAAFAGFKVSNPAKRLRWMHGPVKFLVLREEKKEVVGPDGKKQRIPEIRVITDCNNKYMPDAYWVPEAGLADPKGLSFRSMAYPNSYLAIAEDGFVNVVENDGSEAFAKNATWFQRPGNERKELLSFESAAKPGEFLRTKGRMATDPLSAGGCRMDSTFEIID